MNVLRDANVHAIWLQGMEGAVNQCLGRTLQYEHFQTSTLFACRAETSRRIRLYIYTPMRTQLKAIDARRRFKIPVLSANEKLTRKQ